ncbi:hypothetical protein [Kribbella sindirgiensis]|uniref:Uncharacterized protein n=1 Tax=Kribbella sindirgiensis TaxID=1124744 RepID=A0A4R0JEJ2_9ACTN|nr:hypothetical protein [Kribbella sindirgiensis]TCC43046.1 hypothetical protein E0H50_00720 [Kribbella sindirgiensis]
MKTHDIDAAVRGLNPQQSADSVSDNAWSELADAVTADASTPVVHPLRRSQPSRRLALVAACTLLIAGVVAATVVNRPDQSQPQALSFTERGDKLIVRVVDPNADPKRYNAEFKKMGLDVTVLSVAVSPPWVGKMISFSGRNEKDMSQLRMLEPGEQCNGTLNASDPGCQEGVELPKNYDGKTEIQFGRVAKPGEMYVHTSSSATDKGEVLAGLTVKNKTIDQVLPLVRSRGVREIEYLTSDGPKHEPVKSPPGNWYVDDASTYAEGVVSLYVSPTPVK